MQFHLIRLLRAAIVLSCSSLVVVCHTLTIGVASASPVSPNSTASDRQEVVLDTRDGVVRSYVSYHLPLPAGSPAHPAQCDRVGYLRYRPSDGPASPSSADSVVVQEQGLGGGAMNSDSVAHNTVHSASAAGMHIEFWALARRSSCLDETTGFDAALKSGNYLDAVDYYFNRKPVNGKVFPGFRQNSDLAVLDGMGLSRVLRDQYEIMLAELPDPKVRQEKAVCTGISMGGLVTGFFADWDFDGDSATTEDAGYNQCQSFAAQDTLVSSDPVALQNTPILRSLTNAVTGTAGAVVEAGYASGVLPRTLSELPVLGTRSFLLYRLAGLAAHLDPDGESKLLQHIPRDPVLDLTLNFLFAASPADFLAGDASGNTIRDFRFTNAALLGVLTDNNTVNFSLFQQGTGVLSGGPVVEKTFPVAGSVTQIPFLGSYLELASGRQTRVGPANHDVLYTWRNYDDVGRVWYTSPGHEVADQRDQARQMATGFPGAYWETYFPIGVVTDLGAGYGGSRSGDLGAVRYAGMSRTKPNFVAFAGDGSIQKSAGTLFPPPALADIRTLPGYNHIDTIGAAAVQNDGKPDYSGQYLADFIRQQVNGR